MGPSALYLRPGAGATFTVTLPRSLPESSLKHDKTKSLPKVRVTEGTTSIPWFDPSECKLPVRLSWSSSCMGARQDLQAYHHQPLEGNAQIC